MSDNDIIFCFLMFYFQRIQIGLYVVHLQEWFQALSRENVFILRTEDWHLHKQMKTLPNIFKFLKIGKFCFVVCIGYIFPFLLSAIDLERNAKKSRNFTQVSVPSRIFCTYILTILSFFCNRQNQFLTMIFQHYLKKPAILPERDL